ncbi:MAG: hypothetical protein WA825_02495 [Steroidobacteraceae bacterium]
MSSRDYIAVPGYAGLRLCVRSFAPHSPTIGLCYIGPLSELVTAGVASLEMLTTVKSGFDAAGDHYTTDAHWSVSGPGPQRYRIWRKMKRVRALGMPGVHEALAHAVQARRSRANQLAPQQRHDQRQR